MPRSTSVDADGETRCVLITGAGRAFSAGGDLEKYIDLQRDPVEFPRFVADLHATFGRLRTLRVPVIALVNGAAVAGGLELLLNCDFAIAAQSARIGDGHLNFGQMGGGGVADPAPPRDRPRASGRADLHRSAPRRPGVDGLGSRQPRRRKTRSCSRRASSWPGEIATKSPLAVANAKDIVQTVWATNGPEADALQLERERNDEYCLNAEDAREGLQAFKEKRPPRFTGR